MNIYKDCDNCVHLGINKNCLRYPPFKTTEYGVHTHDSPQESGGNVKLWQEACGEYVPDFDEMNRRLDRHQRSIDKERRALKKEIKRLGGNPRKLGVA